MIMLNDMENIHKFNSFMFYVSLNDGVDLI